MHPKTRRFNLGDLMILIAAIAASIVGARSVWSAHRAGRGVIATKQVAYDRLLVAAMLSACATPLTVACLASRARGPRPPWRRVGIQPGAAATVACVAIFGAKAAVVAASFAWPDVYRPWGPAEYGRASPIRFSDSSHLVLIRSMNREGVIASIEPFACHSTLVASFAAPCGPAVAAVWLVLALSGRWRPERSWIDRLGRGLGVLWILISALTAIPV